MKRYEIAYAYPTSPTAKKFGKYNEGCYVLRIIETGESDIDVSAHDTLDECATAGVNTKLNESSSSRRKPHKF